MNPFPKSLREGYTSFRFGRLKAERARYEELAEKGQKPSVLIIGCCDSRAAPEIIFGAAPGELFVVRNVANLVPPYVQDDDYHGTSAALEFAVQALKVEHIVVLGHGRCGGIKAFLSKHDEDAVFTPLSPGDFIGKWISLLEPAVDNMVCEDSATIEARQRALEEEGIRQSMRNLLTFPCVKIQTERGKIQLHGAWFDISSGDLHTISTPDGEAFKPVREA